MRRERRAYTIIHRLFSEPSELDVRVNCYLGSNSNCQMN
jgi:hypothetical protein